jgi:hypothetical protein
VAACAARDAIVKLSSPRPERGMEPLGRPPFWKRTV